MGTFMSPRLKESKRSSYMFLPLHQIPALGDAAGIDMPIAAADRYLLFHKHQLVPNCPLHIILDWLLIAEVSLRKGLVQKNRP